MKTITTLLLSTFLVSPLIAQDDHDHDHEGEQDAEMRELDAHEHGVSELSIAIDGAHVAMDFMSPGMDIVGFEHEPSSDEDRAAVEKAIIDLGNPKALFAPAKAAGCDVTEIFAHRHGAEAHDEEMHEEAHEHEEAEHEEAHDEEAHEAHGEHSAFHAKWEFHCQDIDALSHIDIAFFEKFENAQKVQISLVSEEGAVQHELDREMNKLELQE